ncbi:MAG: hypothetical protein MI802_05760 [Desulfobacterales bacterium]|nr:hypothetical protein [Desulfobacterales bacterium]
MGADPSGHNGLFWGYYLSHGYHMRFHGDVQPVYQYLLDLVGRKNYFIITTNVDALFLRNGFSPDRIYTPQGDYGRIQCQTPCSEQTWPSEPVIRGLLPLIDPVTGELPEEHIPVCPNCGGPVFFNLRGGGWFVDSPYQDQQEAYTYWLDKARNKKLLLMDIGTGFHTPVWIRWPFERLTAGITDSSLVRINRDDARVPMSIEQRALSFQHGAMDVLKATINTKI